MQGAVEGWTYAGGSTQGANAGNSDRRGQKTEKKQAETEVLA